MLAETESPFDANVTIIFNSVPSTLIDPTHGPSGDWEEATGATKTTKARSAALRGFMGENRWISEGETLKSGRENIGKTGSKRKRTRSIRSGSNYPRRVPQILRRWEPTALHRFPGTGSQAPAVPDA